MNVTINASTRKLNVWQLNTTRILNKMVSLVKEVGGEVIPQKFGPYHIEDSDGRFEPFEVTHYEYVAFVMDSYLYEVHIGIHQSYCDSYSKTAARLQENCLIDAGRRVFSGIDRDGDLLKPECTVEEIERHAKKLLYRVLAEPVTTQESSEGKLGYETSKEALIYMNT